MSLDSVPRRAESDEDEFDDAVHEPVVDHGELSPGTRRVLLALIRGPYVSERTQSKLWPALIRDEQVVRTRLADLYLDLILDTEGGIAFVRNLDVDDAPRVVRSHPLTLIDTVLVLFLRRTLLAKADSSVRAFVGRDEIEDQLRSYRSADASDKTGYDKRIEASINKMKDNAVLLSTDDPDRWEVSPVLALIFGPDEAAAVDRQLKALVEP